MSVTSVSGTTGMPLQAWTSSASPPQNGQLPQHRLSRDYIGTHEAYTPAALFSVPHEQSDSPLAASTSSNRSSSNTVLAATLAVDAAVITFFALTMLPELSKKVIPPEERDGTARFMHSRQAHQEKIAASVNKRFAQKSEGAKRAEAVHVAREAAFAKGGVK